MDHVAADKLSMFRLSARRTGRSLVRLLAILPVAALYACSGGGGGGDGGSSSPATFTVGGTVQGLNGTLTLRNGGDPLDITHTGPTNFNFVFATRLVNGATYSVSVHAQPVGQSCAVTNGSGTLSGANVTNVQVICSNNVYAVRGTLTGLSGTITLRNNGGDDLVSSSNGVFGFATAVAHGSTYSVVVHSQPSGQTCTVASGAGTINAADVTDVAVSCVTNPPAAPTLNVSYGIKKFRFSWTAVANTTYYRLYERTNSGSGYVQVGGNINGTNFDYDVAVHRVNWPDIRFVVQACNSGGCTDSAAVDVLSGVLDTIGYVKANSRTYEDLFGSTVALSADGNTLAVGAPWEDSESAGVGGVLPANCNGDADPGAPSTSPCRNAGAVYVYAKSAGVWQFQSYIKASNTQSRDHFGTGLSLSADGNVLAVASTWEDGPDDGTVNQSGAVYIYARRGAVWDTNPVGYLRPTGPGANEFFGAPLVLSPNGTQVAVGVPGEGSASVGVGSDPIHNCDVTPRINCARNAGAVYVFTHNGTDWSGPPVYIKASDATIGGRFGYSLAYSGDGSLLAVGSITRASAVGQSGAVYVYATATWTPLQTLIAANAGVNDQFGSSVAMSNDGSIIAVGADKEDSADAAMPADNSSADAGAVYIFTGTSGVWSQQAYLKASNVGAGDNFGATIALSSDGNMLAVGAPSEGSSAEMGADGQNDNSAPKAGAVYVYTYANGAWTQVNYIKAPNTDADADNEEFGGTTRDQFGAALSLSADGSTLAVGARYEDGSNLGVGTVNPATGNDGAHNSGAVYLY